MCICIHVGSACRVFSRLGDADKYFNPTESDTAERPLDHEAARVQLAQSQDYLEIESVDTLNPVYFEFIA